ncbi:MAG: hypothetical protein IJV62_01425, partial [Eggerthellaceae bacterium]|nr:hypothetical protein [Eggerthellaceae bacterium]
GWHAITYARPVGACVDELFKIAQDNLSEKEAAFLEPLQSLSKKRISPREKTLKRLEDMGVIA